VHPQPALLVFGGSQGARALNEAMMAAAPRLSTLDLRLTHQTGEADRERVEAAYRAAGLGDARVRSFIDDMATAYAEADLVLCRAGAMTLAEVTVCGRPAILVPFPFAVDDHQTANARAVAEAGAAIHLPQPELTPERLVGLITELFADRGRLATMAARAKALGRPDAARAIADALLEEVARV
jgi:UDP-N-acetylglucosamine--N-acetylmuramyl-(pentapeptide) pyrophosphoryl-undecaprenol N-acetylglucosamine transferase